MHTYFWIPSIKWFTDLFIYLFVESVITTNSTTYAYSLA